MGSVDGDGPCSSSIGAAGIDRIFPRFPNTREGSQRMSQEPLADTLDRLATRISAGDVVFFIGAGYSLDSERNTTGVLLARLLARFEAITSVVCAGSVRDDSEMVALCTKLRTGLR